MSPAEVSHFKEQGYVIKRGLLPADSLAPFVDEAWEQVPAGIDRGDPATWLDAGSRWVSNNLYHAHGGVCTNPPDENSGGRLWWDCSSDDFLGATSWSAAMLTLVEALIGGPVKRPGRCRGMYTIWPRRGEFESANAAGATLGPHVDTETEQLLAVTHRPLPSRRRRHSIAHHGVDRMRMVTVCAQVTYLSKVGPSGGNFVVWPGSHKLMYAGFDEEINPVAKRCALPYCCSFVRSCEGLSN